MVEVLDWVSHNFPELELRIAWNQPMFTHHGTYIIGFSAVSKHMAMVPERATMIRFEPVMRERGTDFGKMFARQPWNKPFDYELLDAFIQHQLAEKKDITSFWRPKEHELAATEAVASGEQPPTVRECAADDAQPADSFLEEFLRYVDNPHARASVRAAQAGRAGLRGAPGQCLHARRGQGVARLGLTPTQMCSTTQGKDTHP